MIRNLLIGLLLLVTMLAMASTTFADRPYCGKVCTDLPEGEMTLEDGTVHTGYQDWGSFSVVSDEYVLTNYHVVSDYLEELKLDHSAAIVLFFANDDIKNGSYFKGDEEHDLALIRFEGGLGTGVHRIGIAGYFSPRRVTVAGYPGGGDYVEISARRFEDVGTDSVRFPGIFHPGISGSPVIDETGKLCAVLWGSDYTPKSKTNHGYAVRVEYVRELLEGTGVLEQPMGSRFLPVK